MSRKDTVGRDGCCVAWVTKKEDGDTDRQIWDLPHAVEKREGTKGLGRGTGNMCKGVLGTAFKGSGGMKIEEGCREEKGQGRRLALVQNCDILESCWVNSFSGEMRRHAEP